MKRFRSYDPEQPYLLPPDPREWLPEDHLALFLHDLVDQLDVTEIVRAYGDGDSGGYPPFDPRMMLRIWIYAYATGVRSSRKVAKALVDDVAYRFLSGNQQPKYWALNQFRTRHREAFSNLFIQSVHLAAAAGLVKLGHVAIDGSKLKANASLNKAMSYARLTREEARLREEFDAYLDACDEVDAKEDDAYGPGDGEQELPEHLRSRAGRLKAIREAKERLERDAQERAAREQEARRDAAVRADRAYHPRVDPADAKPRPSEQRNFTDPDSRVMRKGTAFVQAFNTQAAVDSYRQVIVATHVTNLAPDTPHLPDLLSEVHDNLAAHPEEVSADAGYYSDKNLDAIENRGARPFVATGRITHHEWRNQKPPQGRIPKGLTRRERMKRLLSTKAGRAAYLKRQTTVEPVFGQILHARALHQAHHRGLEKVNAFWRFDCAIHNLLKLFRYGPRTWIRPVTP